MKNSINYYYNFNVDEVEKWDTVYRFNIKNDIFYFVPLKRMSQELDDIIIVSKELKIKGIPVHDIILNRYGKVFSNVYNTNYVLLRPIGDIYQEYDLETMINLNKNLVLNQNKSGLYRNSWASLWSAKIDYFEYQVRELGKDKSLILDTFSYYVGMGENAISYVNSTISKYKPTINDKICLSHRRISYPNYKLNFLNPLSFIFDLEVRDIAEYIKSSFFTGDDALNYLKYALKVNNFSIYSLQLLYARLLYPTFYFDLYEKIMNDEVEQDTLISIIDKAEDYEKFLKDVYFEIYKYVPIERVEWLLKNKKEL